MFRIGNFFFLDGNSLLWKQPVTGIKTDRRTNSIKSKTQISIHTPTNTWFLTKKQKNIKWKKIIFDKWCLYNWISTCRRMKIYLYLSSCTKLKSKRIKDLNIKSAILNLIEEKVGSTLECIGTGDHFLNITSVAQTPRETINKWDLLKLKSLCKAKDMVNKTEWQPTEWKKIFTNPHQSEVWSPKYTKNSQQSN